MKREHTVGFLGPVGTYSDLCAQKLYPHTLLKPYETVDDLIDGLRHESVDIAIVPIHNSIAGTMQHHLDLAMHPDLEVIQTVDLPIHHMLLSTEERLSDIHMLYSHAHIFAQCEKWIAKHLPHARCISARSCTEALQHIEPQTGYIASREAAEEYHIPILIEDIEDHQDNITTFYALARKNPLEKA